MRVTRLYHPNELECSRTIQLTAESSNHLIRVLRTRPNQPVILFNGDGCDYFCTTIDDHPKKTSVHIDSKQIIDNESNLSITLIQGLSRQERMETTIQKSVELGVNKIIPVMCQRSNLKLNDEKKQKKHQHWKNIVISACEQSGRCVIPEITKILTLDKINPFLKDSAFKILLYPESNQSLKEESPDSQSIEIFIGPEGGINDEEKQLLEKIKFNQFAFGPRVLRTETAGPAVISALQMLWGDF